MSAPVRWSERGALGASGLLALALVAAPAWAGKPNKPPTVSLTSPAAGSVFVAPASIVLAADAADADGTVVGVEFFHGTTSIGSVSAAPWTVTWNDVPAGAYSLTARATDNLGATTTSTAVSITVKASPPDLILSPANGAALYGSTVTLSGRFEGDPATTSILADNGNSTRLAIPSGNNYSVSLPLFRGPNTLTVVVARTDRSWDRASVTVTGNDAPYVAFRSPTAGEFEAPAAIELEAEALSPGGAVSRVEFFDNGAALASVTSPPYRHTWSNPPVGNHTLSAKATDDNGAAATAFRQVTVTAPNTLPSVTLTSPAHGASYTAPASIVLSASATDPDGSISQVEFLRDGAVLATDTAAPFSFTWSGVPVGTYTLAARATDNRSGVTTSAPVTVTVVPPNAPPSVSLDAPAEGATFVAPADITLAASAADSDGSIARVEFYRDGTLIGTAAAAPYSQVWIGVAAGTYRLTARAVDDRGAATDSPAVTITVNDPPPNVPPSVALTSPASGTDRYAPTTVSLAASASDSDGAVAKVEFFAGATLLATDTTAPYSFDWVDPPAGVHTLTAVATDDAGAATTSAPVTVTLRSLGLAIASPGNGATVAGDRVIVSGTFDAPFNSGITVNGVVAAIVGDRFYANLRLAVGGNEIRAVLTTPAAQTLEQGITLYADGVQPFLEIGVERLEGVDPLEVVFTLTNSRSVDADVVLDGQTSFVVPADSSIPVTITYGAGAYTARFDATNALGESMSESFSVVAHDPAAMDQKFTAIWNGMNDALLAGDKAGAMGYLSLPAQEKYGPVFDVLMPEYSQVLAAWSPLLRASLSRDIGEYGVVAGRGGAHSVFLIYFVRGADGIWRLEAM